MNDYFMIENFGECSPELFLTFGASSKEKDSKQIGYFGSGGKYALSCLLREGVEFAITTGSHVIRFKTQEESLKATNGEVKINAIFALVDGTPIKLHGFTTEFGRHSWDLEKSIHELVSNAVDESDGEKPRIEFADKIIPTKGITRIFVENTPETCEIFENLPRYFLCMNDKVPKNHLKSPVFRLEDPDEEEETCLSPFVRNGRRYKDRFKAVEPSFGHDFIYNLPFPVSELREISSFDGKYTVQDFYLRNPENEFFNVFSGANMCNLSIYRAGSFSYLESLVVRMYLTEDERRRVLDRIVSIYAKDERRRVLDRIVSIYAKAPNKKRLLIIPEEKAANYSSFTTIKEDSSVYVMKQHLYDTLKIEETEYDFDEENTVDEIEQDLELEEVLVENEFLTKACYYIFRAVDAGSYGYNGYNFNGPNSLPTTYIGNVKKTVYMNDKLILPRDQVDKMKRLMPITSREIIKALFRSANIDIDLIYDLAHDILCNHAEHGEGGTFRLTPRNPNHKKEEDLQTT